MAPEEFLGEIRKLSRADIPPVDAKCVRYIRGHVYLPGTLEKPRGKAKEGRGGAAAGLTATSGGIQYLLDSATRHFHFSFPPFSFLHRLYAPHPSISY
ncbi:hypothetical protein KM043_009095 [Ampulex compressa]|nr:hypothetical protein KM043_009095 [Ampulex compressa]